MKLGIILQEKETKGADLAYLGVQIVDLSDSDINVAGMNGLSYFYARLDGLLFKRQHDVGFPGKLFSCSGIAFADQVVHDDEVDVPDGRKSAMDHDVWLARSEGRCVKANRSLRNQRYKLTCSPHVVSERFPTYLCCRIM